MLACLLGASAGQHDGASAPQDDGASAPGPAAAAPSTLGDDLVRYLDLLGRVRRGEDEAIEPLRRLAREMCRRWDRCDTQAVAEFYCGLSVAERGAGLAQEARFAVLRSEVVAAGRGELDGSWEERSAELMDGLLDVAEQSTAQPDFSPAASAYGLLALLELERARDLAGLGDEARGNLLALARNHAQQSLELFARAGQQTPQLDPLWTLGRTERARGVAAEAAAAFQRCGELARRLGREPYRRRALLGSIELARDSGDLPGIDHHLEELASFTSPAECWPLAREHAARLLHMDRAEAALAFALANPPLEPADEAQWHALLAACFLRAGDLPSARREVTVLSDSQRELTVLARASLALAAGEHGAALELLEMADRSGWSRLSQAQSGALLGEAWLAVGRPELAREHLERALDVSRSWEERHAGTSRGSVVGEWIGLHTVVLLARARAQLGDGLGAALALEEHQSRRLRRADGAGRAGAGGADDARRPTREGIARWARSYEGGLLTWGIGPDSSVVVHVDAQGNALAEPLPHGRREFERAVRRLREATLSGSQAQAGELAREIGEALLPERVRERLLAATPQGGRTLFLAHGPLEALPLALIELDGRPLDERLTLLVLPGLPAAEPGGEEPALAEAAWTLMGSPLDTDVGHPLLPGAARELAQLARLYPRARLSTGTVFVRAALIEALRGQGPLHVATHLIEAPDCGEARLAPVALQLSGGELMCAEEIRALGPRLPLVVLSACETGGGRFVDAEGLHGVGRAFLESGTRNLLVSLWPVTDEAARSYMLAFHEGLRSGARPSAAARDARARLARDGHAAADWAAFRFLGRD